MKTAAFSAAELRFGLDTPGPGFVGLLRERARRSPARGFQRLRTPLGDRPKAGRSAGSFARRSAKVDCAARTSSRRSAKADYAARTSPRRSAKADHGAWTSPRRSAKADNAARTSSRRSAKADCAAGLLHGEARKPTTPQDFAPAKCKSRLRRSSFPGPGFWPPGRARRRGERRASL